MSIRQKLLVFVLVGAVLPLLFVFTVSFSVQRDDMRRSVQASLMSDVSHTVDALNDKILDANHNLRSFSRLIVMQQVRNRDIFRRLENDLNKFVDAHSLFSDVTAVDSSGDVVASTNKNLVGENIKQRIEFQRAFKGFAQVYPPRFSKEDSQYTSIQSTPIYDNQYNIIGVLTGTINWQFVNSILERTNVLGMPQSENRILTLMSTDNDTLLYRTKNTTVSYSDLLKTSIDEPFNVQISGKDFVTIAQQPTIDLQGFRPYENSPILVQVMLDKKTAYAPLDRLTTIYVWIGVVVIGFVGVLWWLLSQSIGQRIYRLGVGAHELSKGNFDYQLQVQDKRDEIGSLTQSFIDMRAIVKQNEQALIEKTNAAEQAARLKGEFLANMSHEIRTPINGVLGMAELLLQTDQNINQKRYTSTILRSGQSLLSVVNDILDFSKIEAGKLDITVAPFDLREVIEDVAEMLAESAHRKGLELNVELPPQAHIAFSGDAGRIRQVLVNLISNAIKFTASGEIKIRVNSLDAREGQLTNVRFEIIDTGIGISRKQQTRVFEEFEQGDGTTTREFGGTGLGLAISKKLVELMSGSIGITSSVGNGSTFHFSVLLERLPASVQQRWASERSLTDRRFLIVDDNVTNRDILRTQLTHWGAQTIVANDPEHALQIIEDCHYQNDLIDVAIIDQQMPKMCGTDLIRKACSRWPSIATKFVILSSVNSQRDEKTSRQLSEHPHITKPARQKDLYNCLAATLGDDQALNASIDQKRLEHATLCGEILLVEDNPVNQDMMLEMLKLMGLVAELAENGEEAVTRLTERRFDMVFMDCQMPIMDGFAATSAIRQRELHSGDSFRQPIVALTANALEGDRERCIGAGMDDYLSKPVSSAELRMCLQKWLPHSEDATAIDETLSAAANVSNTDAVVSIDSNVSVAASEASTSHDKLPVIDQVVYQELLSMCEQASEGFYDRLASKFVDSSAHDLTNIEDAMQHSDSEKLRLAAHRLKSSSANWGGVRVSRLCQQLENAGREEELGNLPTLLVELKKEVNVLIESLHVERKAA